MKRTSKTTSTPTKAFVYIRVSTARQAEHGVSLEAQEARCRALAEARGLEVVEVFADEGVSGKDSIEDRNGLRRLVKAFRENQDAVVIVYSISRLARRQRLLWHLLDAQDGEGLSVVSATEPFETQSPMGKAMLGMIAVFAQLEADMISERTRDALTEIKSQGRRLGQRPMAEMAPETVQLIKEMYASGKYTQSQLVDELNRRGVPTARGKGKWWLRTVQVALSSP